jgi:glucan phosphoethanolaminetransferase (alkaline phosphatase superfamily)
VPGPLQYAIWLVCTLLEAAVLVCAYRRNATRRYLFLNVYMACEVLASVVRFEILQHYGLLSPTYAYFYYYSDALLTILLFFALSNLYSQVFAELQAERYVQLGAVVLLSGTALFSFAVVEQSSAKLVSHFVVEISQNLYFVGLVLTYILWAAILKLRETRTRLIQMVLSLGIYFSLYAANYALRNLYPSIGYVFQSLNPLIGCFLPFAWAYAFWRIPEDARLAPSRLAVSPR